MTPREMIEVECMDSYDAIPGPPIEGMGFAMREQAACRVIERLIAERDRAIAAHCQCDRERRPGRQVR